MHNKQHLIKKSWFIGVIAVAIVVALLILIGKQWLAKEIDADRTFVQEKLQREFGFPVKFSNISTHWIGLSIAIRLDEVQILDQTKTSEWVPFIAMEALELRTNLFTLLWQKTFKQQIEFNNIKIQGLKMVLGFCNTNPNSLTILSLEGECLPGKVDYHALIAAMADRKIRLKEAEIIWQLPFARTSELSQRLSGMIRVSKTKNISFKGAQRVKLISLVSKEQTRAKVEELNNVASLENIETIETADPWEKSYLDFSYSSETEKGHLATKVLQTEIGCNFHSGNFNCQADAKNIDIQALQQHLPIKASDAAWLRWLKNALVSGQITSADLNVSGTAQKLDFHGLVNYENLSLRYHPNWPLVQQASGQIEINQDGLYVQMNNGNILGSEIKEASADITEIATSGPLKVQVNAKLFGRLEQGMHFLLQSPLKNKIGTPLASLKPQGPLDLDLNLNLAVAKDEIKVKADGNVITTGASLILPNLDLQVNQLNGVFHFTEQGVSANNVHAEILGRPFVADVSPAKITVTGPITAHFIKKQFKNSLFNYLHGEMVLTVAINAESLSNVATENQPVYTVSSDLQGLEIDLPAPFAKAADAKMPMTLSIFQPFAKGEQKFSLNLQALMDAKWMMTKEKTLETEGSTSQTSWKFKRGHIVFGKGSADWISKDNLLINGDIVTLNIKEWWNLFNKQTTNNNNMLANFIPVQAHVLTNNLDVFGLKFKKTWLDFASAKKQITLYLEGSSVRGGMTLPPEKNKEIQLKFDLLHLVTDEQETEIETEFLKNDNKRTLSFECKHLNFNNRDFGAVTFQLNPKPYGYDIQNLKAQTNIYSMEAEGVWQLKDDQSSSSNTKLSGEISSQSMGKTFEAFGLSSAIKEAAGHIRFELEWPKNPIRFDLQTVQGNAAIHLKSGRILGVDAGLGRVLGLLSLDNIHRRLKLDFSDLYKQGFVFDTIDAKLQFENGFAKTNSFVVEGPAATINLVGETDLKTKQLDLQMSVWPKMSAGLPLAASIATANPFVGVGVWAFSKVVGSQMGGITRHNYRVTGTWDAPKINEK